MRKKIFAILAVLMLSACTVNNNVDVATPSAESQSSEDAEMNDSIKERDAALLPGKVDNDGPVPPSVLYETILDKEIERMEDDTVSVWKTRITKIEEVDGTNPDESIIAGMKLDYYISFEDSPEAEVNIYSLRLKEIPESSGG